MKIYLKHVFFILWSTLKIVILLLLTEDEKGKRKQVKFSAMELKIILRTSISDYQDLEQMIMNIQANIEHLPQDARHLYGTNSIPRLKQRIRDKLNSLLKNGSHPDPEIE